MDVPTPQDFSLAFRMISAFVCAIAQYLNTSQTVQHATNRVDSLLTTVNVVGTASTACTEVLNIYMIRILLLVDFV